MRTDREREVAEAAEAWTETVRDRDEAAVAEFLHPDFVLISSRGWNVRTTDRQRWLRNAIDDWNLQDFRFEDVDIHVYGDVAVMRSRFIQKATVSGRPLNFTAFITDVWVNDGRRWRVATRHASPTDLDAETLRSQSERQA